MKAQTFIEYLGIALCIMVFIGGCHAFISSRPMFGNGGAILNTGG